MFSAPYSRRLPYRVTLPSYAQSLYIKGGKRKSQGNIFMRTLILVVVVLGPGSSGRPGWLPSRSVEGEPSSTPSRVTVPPGQGPRHRRDPVLPSRRDPARREERGRRRPGRARPVPHLAAWSGRLLPAGLPDDPRPAELRGALRRRCGSGDSRHGRTRDGLLLETRVYKDCNTQQLRVGPRRLPLRRSRSGPTMSRASTTPATPSAGSPGRSSVVIPAA